MIYGFPAVLAHLGKHMELFQAFIEKESGAGIRKIQARFLL
tara:strand:- start:185 stop:307 length:123 start_codon:yes stop_codon:yes gene_type:complete